MSNSSGFKLEYEVTPQDYAQFSKLMNVKKGPVSKPGQFLLGLLIVLPFVLPVVLYETGVLERFFSGNAHPAGPIYLGIAIMVLAIPVLSMVSRPKKITGGLDFVTGRRQMAIDEGKVTISQQYAKTDYDLHAIRHVVHSEKMIVLWLDGLTGIPVPTSAFVSDEDRQKFSELVSARLT